MGDLLQFVQREELRRKTHPKPDWKEWIPLYGVHVAMQAAKHGRPNHLDGVMERGEVRFLYYHFGIPLLLTYLKPYA